MREGKIIKALSGFYYVLSDDKVIQCRGRGVLRKNKITPLVGDHVLFQAENEREGYVMDVKERKNELVRPPIANIDQAILVFSAAEPDFSPILLDRFLTIIEAKAISSLIVLTKIDLLTEEDRNELEKQLQYYHHIGYETLVTSSNSKEGFEQLKNHLQGKTSVFAGQSGVGKSTLLNVLLPELELKTGEISSHLGRGRHTTRHVELVTVGSGLVADTPGFSSVEFTEIDLENLGRSFREINEQSVNCKFRLCLHMNEPHCAVKQAVDVGDISRQRYEHYLQFAQEIKDRKPRY